MRGRTRPASQQSMRRHNLALVMDTVARHGPVSRAAVAGHTGLTRPAVSSLVDELLAAGLLTELGPAANGRVGRPGSALMVSDRGPAGLGLEVGVEHLGVCVTDLRGQVRVWTVVESPNAALPPAGVLARLSALAGSAVAEAAALGLRPVAAVMAVPGLVARDSGTVESAPNLGWHDIPVTELWPGALPPRVENEANLGALAELWAHPVAADFIHVSAESGIGAALVVGGRLFTGARGLAGELGHMPVHPDGPPCSCGARGCLEQYAAKAAVLRAAGLPAPPPLTSPTPSDAVSGSPQAPSIPPGGQSAPPPTPGPGLADSHAASGTPQAPTTPAGSQPALPVTESGTPVAGSQSASPPTPESATAPAGSRSASSLTPGSGPADSRSASPSTPGSSATPEGMPTDHATAPLDAPASSQPGHEAARPSVSGIPQAGTTPASLPPGSGVSAGQPRPVSHDEPADGRAGHRAASSESAAARSYRTGAVAAEARRRDSAVSVAVSPPEPGVGEAEGRLSGVPAEGSPAGAGTAGKERAAARSYGPEVVRAEGPFSVPAEKADPLSGPGAAGKERTAARSYEPVRVSAEEVPAGSGAGVAAGLSGGRADGIGVLVARAREGDARVVAALEDAGRALGTALAGAVNLLDPAAVVLGGAYAELGEWLVPPMRRELAARVTVRAWDPQALTVSELGRRGPLLGAALATVRSVLEDPASLWA